MRQLIFILVLMIVNSCSKPIFKSKWINEKSPEIFVAKFETNKGSFDVRVKREWSPLAADRFYQLIKHHFYDRSIFYRVDSNFVAQFGASDTIKIENWSKYKLRDEPVIHSNKKGTLSFARGGKETRGSELFINTNDNQFLDTIFFSEVKGFPAFGNVIRGMEIVESLYAGYGDNTMRKLDTMYADKQKFLDSFPKLDSIKKAYIIKTKAVANEEKTISFSGLKWKVRNVSGTQGPGPNYFSNKSVWVDNQGTLHLYLHKDSITGNWLCPEITSEKEFQFGTYTFEIEGAIDKMDKDVVLGLFNYSGNDGYDEIDIEFARWGNNGYPNLNYTVWPAEKKEYRNSSYSKEYLQQNNNSTQQFIWNKDSIAFYTFNGFSTDKKDLIDAHSFTQPPASISSLFMPIHINLWLFEGKPPMDNKPIEILIHRFSFKK